MGSNFFIKEPKMETVLSRYSKASMFNILEPSMVTQDGYGTLLIEGVRKLQSLQGRVAGHKVFCMLGSKFGPVMHD